MWRDYHPQRLIMGWTGFCLTLGMQLIGTVPGYSCRHTGGLGSRTLPSSVNRAVTARPDTPEEL
jgi:hypothetical protein